MKKLFGIRKDGKEAFLYTLSSGGITAEVTNHGATLVNLFVPDKNGLVEDVTLGFDNPDAYTVCQEYLGTIVGRNSNRIRGAKFTLNGKEYRLDANDFDENNLHSGFDAYKDRLWQEVEHTENSVKLRLDSPDGDQGFPGNAVIYVTYIVEGNDLRIVYDATADQDTVFNLTNHAYFNLAGHDKTELAMEQVLTMPATFFNPCDAQNLPTGEDRSVEGTPMDFRTPKALGRDMGMDYEPLKLQDGYDHNFEVAGEVCATLHDPHSGRTMQVITDCPGVQLYCANCLAGDVGKGGVSYTKYSGVCLETQYMPDSVNHPQWKQPVFKAGELYHSETIYRFC